MEISHARRSGQYEETTNPDRRWRSGEHEGNDEQIENPCDEIDFPFAQAQTHVRNILERVRGYCTDELTGKRVVLPLSVEGQVDHLIRVRFDLRCDNDPFSSLSFSKRPVMNYYVRCLSAGQPIYKFSSLSLVLFSLFASMLIQISTYSSPLRMIIKKEL